MPMSADGKRAMVGSEVQARGMDLARVIAERNEVLARRTGAQSTAWRLSTNR